ncbi:MAG: hypothetical protein NVS1B13_14810 [Flavisolibacter sp.]
MKVSVIIPTYNGAHKLRGIIESLRNQSFSHFEIIVVVDGSTDNTVSLLEKMNISFQEFTVISQENGGRAKVRNTGASHSRGDLLIFFDDDMVIGFETIAEHVKHHLEFSGSILTGEYREPYRESTSDFFKFKAYLSKRWTAPFNSAKTVLIKKENLYLAAGNFSLLKNTFFSLGGFDESLTDAEDYDLAMRAIQRNIPIYFSHEAFSYHNEEVDCQTYIIRLRQYKLSHIRLGQIKPDLYHNDKLLQQIPTGIKGIVFKIFRSDWWVRSVDKGLWVWLPSKIRFKLYDIVVTANGSYYEH